MVCKINSQVLPVIVEPGHRKRTGIGEIHGVQSIFIRPSRNIPKGVDIAVFLPFPVNTGGFLTKEPYGILDFKAGIIGINQRVVLPGISKIHSVQAGKAQILNE